MTFETGGDASLVNLTRHAMMRIAQRGFRDGDVELIMAIGTEVEGGYLVRRKDVQEAERHMRRWLKRLPQLAGKRLVVTGDTLVTAYHAKPGKERELLKNR